MHKNWFKFLIKWKIVTPGTLIQASTFIRESRVLTKYVLHVQRLEQPDLASRIHDHDRLE